MEDNNIVAMRLSYEKFGLLGDNSDNDNNNTGASAHACSGCVSVQLWINASFGACGRDTHRLLFGRIANEMRRAQSNKCIKNNTLHAKS